MQTDHELRESPHDGFVQTCQSREMDGSLAVEHAQLVGIARLARHSEYSRIWDLFTINIRVEATVRVFTIEHLR
jgi:hypothetical protein